MSRPGRAGATDWEVGIVVPARDEERLIRRCLTALSTACTRLLAERPLTRVRTVAVLDSCTDRTAEIVAEFPEVTAVTIRAGRVGTARAAGIAALAGDVCGPRGPRGPRAARTARRTWIASTDADSAVPESWLVDQLALADTGVELVTGFVTTDLSDTPPAVRGLAPTRTHLQDGHPYVYGANLGFTLQTYLDVGGIAPLRAHEDVAFVEHARRHGVRCHASGSICVLTSGRTEGRTPQGYATYLRDLAAPDLASESA